jgi:hypothetical protein
LSAPIPDDLKKILGQNEQPLLFIQQKIYHPKISIDSILITNERVILRHPHAMGLKKDYTDYRYRDISNVILDKGLMRSTVRLNLRFEGDPLTLSDLPNSEAGSAYSLIRGSLADPQGPPGPFQSPPPSGPPTVSQGGATVIEREVVKVKCRYCGTLNDETSRVCTSCGATL